MMLERRLKEWGFPPAQRQVEVHDGDGRLIARADLGIIEWKVLLEYDSDEHHGPRCWIADGVRRDNVEEVGYRMVSVDRLENLRPPDEASVAA